MRRMRFFGAAFILFAAACLVVMAAVVFGLWNALMPPIFGFHAISFWQALGLLLLARILFGRFGRWGPGMRKARFIRGWKGLTPEERERFRRGVRGCPMSKVAETESTGTQ
jgi:hypothetical protein